MELTVVGGGALGMGAALALAEAGHEVVLRERAQLGAGATSKAAGICSTMTWHDDEYRLIAETRGRIGEIISLTAGLEPAARGAWRPHDSLLVAGGDKLRTLDEIQGRLERHGEEPERLGARPAAAAFPALRFGSGEEVLVAQEDGVIEAGDLVAAMRVRLDEAGVEVREGDAVDLAAVQTEGTVVAGGAWTPGLLRAVGVALPAQCFRTQLAAVSNAGVDVPILHDTTNGFYARPESEGAFHAGDGTVLRPHDPDDYNEAGDPEFVESIAERVLQRFKGLDQARVRSSWAGLCVASPDRRPLCGPVPGRDDLWVLTGDNGFGLMRCLALGQRLADAVDGRVDAGLDPGRFPADLGEWEMREGFAF